MHPRWLQLATFGLAVVAILPSASFLLSPIFPPPPPADGPDGMFLAPWPGECPMPAPPDPRDLLCVDYPRAAAIIAAFFAAALAALASFRWTRGLRVHAAWAAACLWIPQTALDLIIRPQVSILKDDAVVAAFALSLALLHFLLLRADPGRDAPAAPTSEAA